MNTKKADNLKSLFILLVLIFSVQFISVLPWWGFSLPVFIAGMVINYRKWQVSFFGIGFLAGFLVWAGANFYFDQLYSGDLLAHVAKLFFLPKVALILISGILAGLVTGLAFYSGKSILAVNRTKPSL